MYVNAVWKPTTHTTRWFKHLTTITAPWVDERGIKRSQIEVTKMTFDDRA
jgi:hypothetical protein